MDDLTRTDGQLRELALFAGAGGGILGGHLLGWRTVCAVEWNAYAASVLAARQNDGCLPPFPIWDDVQTFDGRPWRGLVDVVSGGFPCQDISVAGKGAGIDGERSGMWKHMARIVGEVRPRYVFVENSPALVDRGLGVVLGDLAALGYDAEWGVLGASDVGAPHKRERIWILGYTDSDGRQAYPVGRFVHDGKRDGACAQPGRDDEQPGAGGAGNVAHAAGAGLEGTARKRMPRTRWASIESAGGDCETWFANDPANFQSDSQSFVGRVADGVANRVDRLAALGNGQVASVAALAWKVLTGRT